MTDQAPETVELADVVAFLAAHARGDEQACRMLLGSLGTAGGIRLLGHAIEVAIEVACQNLPGGRAEFQRMLVSWQARRRDSL